MTINFKIFLLVLVFAFIGISQVEAVECTPYADCRYQGAPQRDSTGACSGWALDHIISLDCGGVDAVYNLQWLPLDIKSCAGIHCKDRFERKIYALIPPLPDTKNCVNKLVK